MIKTNQINYMLHSLCILQNATVNTIAIEYPGLLPGVNPDEMLTLNMSDTDIIYAVGSVRGLSKNHVSFN